MSDSLPPDERSAIGSRIREARESRGLTREALAERAKVPVGTLKNWEGGKNAPPADDLLKLHVCGLRAQFILFGEGPPIGEARETEGEYVSFATSEEGRKLLRTWLRMPEAVRVGKLYELDAVATLLERAAQARETQEVSSKARASPSNS